MGIDISEVEAAKARMREMKVLDLFSGIGGLSLGLERAGMRTVAFCEIEPFCRKVLAQHWPAVPIYEDVRELTGERLEKDGIEKIEVITGGFPCQDISIAGKGAGLAGKRSGLWFEFARLIREIQPKYVIVENVSALLRRGFNVVLGDLAALGYDAEWHCIPASAVGAPHRRDRLWIIAYLANTIVPDTNSARRLWARQTQSTGRLNNVELVRCSKNVPDSYRPRLALWEVLTKDDGSQQSPVIGNGRWSSEPDVCRVVNGLPYRVDRVKALGNSIVPRIAELLGVAILNAFEQ